MKSALTRSIDQALDSPDLSLSARVKCLRRLYRTCGFHGILPKRLKVPACYDHNVYPLYKGGFADVWKGEHDGREVAVKVIRTYSRKNLKKIIGVSRQSLSFSAYLTADDILYRGSARRLSRGNLCNITTFSPW